MSELAIRVEGLGKRYQIGAREASYRTLRETLVDLAMVPVRRAKSVLRSDSSAPSSRSIWALRDISFEVNRGDVVGIIGRNGAGKTTLLKILARITPPTQGTIDLYGRVGSLLEVATGFHPELTGRENIYLNGAILGMKQAEIKRRFDEIVAFAEFEEFLDTPVKHYSSGMYVRLAFAVAAHMDPEILLVDEVLAVGDINFRRKCLGRMRDIRASGRTVLFVSHDMSSIRQLCPRALWLEDGSIKEQGPAEEITIQYEAESYGKIASTDGRFERVPTPASNFYIKWVELRDGSGELQTQYRYGETTDLIIALHGKAPQDGFTVEWFLFNERGNRISFGAANPLSDVYFNRGDQLISCRIGPLSLTTGMYRFYFSVRMWGLERWDEWDSGVGFQIISCDPFGTGFNVGSDTVFVLPQTWHVMRT